MISEKGERTLKDKGLFRVLSSIFRLSSLIGKDKLSHGAIEYMVVDLKDENGVRIEYFQNLHGGGKGELKVTDYRHNSEGKVVLRVETKIFDYGIGGWKRIIKELCDKYSK